MSFFLFGYEPGDTIHSNCVFFVGTCKMEPFKESIMKLQSTLGYLLFLAGNVNYAIFKVWKMKENSYHI